MILSHKIQLDPTFEQREYFARAAGTARFVWNWGLAEWDRLYAAGERPNGNTLKKAFNAIKYEQFPWLEDIHRDAHSQPFADLQKAHAMFFRKKAKHPKFKKRGKCKDSFYVANDLLRYTLGEKAVRLPVIGDVCLTEPLRFDGKIMAAIVSRTADRWFIAIRVDVGDYIKPRTGNGVVGVDLGVSNLATLSTGEVIPGSKPLKRLLPKLQRESRRLSRKVLGSQNRQKQKKKLARVHARISNIRNDCVHKLTTKLCRENQAVVIENLCVKGMMGLNLARAVSDMGFYEFRRQLGYKSRIYGTELIIADRFYPSSKTCSNCGEIKDTLSWSERVYKCESCKFEIDRDLNAALNLRTLGSRGTYACGQNSAGHRLTDGETGLVEAGTSLRPLGVG